MGKKMSMHRLKISSKLYTKNNEIGIAFDLDWSNEAAPVSSSESYNAPDNVLSLKVTTSSDDITKLFGSPPSSTADSFNPGSPHQSNITVVNQPVLNNAFLSFYTLLTHKYT